MAGGFHIPSYLVEQQASGLQLVHWVRGVWGSRDPEHDPSAAVVKLAGWLLADTGRIALVEAAGVNVADVLGDRTPLMPSIAMTLSEATGGLIALVDWTMPYSAPAPRPTAGRMAKDAGGTVAAMAVPPASDAAPSAERRALPATAQGRLGECMAGLPLFWCVQIDGRNDFILNSSLGFGCTLDRGAATQAAEVLAAALGLTLVKP